MPGPENKGNKGIIGHERSKAQSKESWPHAAAQEHREIPLARVNISHTFLIQPAWLLQQDPGQSTESSAFLITEDPRLLPRSGFAAH